MTPFPKRRVLNQCITPCIMIHHSILAAEKAENVIGARHNARRVGRHFKPAGRSECLN